MVALPTTIDTPFLQGEGQPAVSVEPTDLGFDSAAQSLERASVQQRRATRVEIESQAKADRQAIQPQMEKLQSDVLGGYTQAAAGLTPDAPHGWALGQIQGARAKLNQALMDPSLSQGQRDQMQLQGSELITRLGQTANEHEANVRAQPIAEQVRAQQNVAVANALGVYYAHSSGPMQDLDDSWDGSTNDYAARRMAILKTAADAAIASAPPEAQGEVTSRLAAISVEEAAKANAVQAAGADKYLYTSALKTGDAAVNNVLSNPNAYDSVKANLIPELVQNAPAKFRPKLEQEWGKSLAYARVRGLIDNGDPDQAMAELKAGRFDDQFDVQTKQELIDRANAADRFHAPRTVDEATAAMGVQQSADAETYARATTGKSTGQVSVAQIARTLGPEKAAEYQQKWQIADQTFAAFGSAKGASNDELARNAAMPAPDPSDPQYAQKLESWRFATEAAQQELKIRSEGAGAWAMSSNKPPPGKMGATGQAQAQLDHGQLLTEKFNAWSQASDPDAKRTAGTDFSKWMIGTQAAAGIPRGSWQIVPKAQAAGIAASVINASPDQKLGAIRSLAGTLDSLSQTVRTPDGTVVNPRDLLVQQLKAAHLSAVDLSAALDFGDDPAKLGRYVAAANDPTLKRPPDKATENALKAAVPAALKTYLDSVRPMPGEGELEQARLDRTTLIARELMTSQGLSANDAAKQAAQDVAGGYAFRNGYRIPARVAGATEVNPLSPNFLTSPGDRIAKGAANLQAMVTGEGGRYLFAPDGAGSPDARRRVAAGQIEKFGRWVTNGDDSGLTLMVPGADGNGWKTVADRYGRPVTMGWDKLQQYSDPAGRWLAKVPFGDPGPQTLRGLDGQPIPAFGPGAAFSALKSAIKWKEGGGPGVVNGKGAGGTWQLTKDTVETYAPKVGEVSDFGRAVNDEAYGEKVAGAAIGDHLRRFGSDAAGMALAAIAYDAGPGVLTGYRDKATGQYHPGWLHTIGDPRQIGLSNFIARIPYRETRDYVRTVLPRALAAAERGG